MGWDGKMTKPVDYFTIKFSDDFFPGIEAVLYEASLVRTQVRSFRTHQSQVVSSVIFDLYREMRGFATVFF